MVCLRIMWYDLYCTSSESAVVKEAFKSFISCPVLHHGPSYVLVGAKKMYASQLLPTFNINGKLEPCSVHLCTSVHARWIRLLFGVLAAVYQCGGHVYTLWYSVGCGQSSLRMALVLDIVFCCACLYNSKQELANPNPRTVTYNCIISFSINFDTSSSTSAPMIDHSNSKSLLQSMVSIHVEAPSIMLDERVKCLRTMSSIITKTL